MKTIKALLALMMLLIPVCAAAQEARELTADCVITSGHVRTTSAHDNDYTTAWRSERVRRPYLEFQLPDGETAGWLYVCFADMPQSWAVEEKIDGKWQVVADGSTDYIHALVELNGQNRFRIVENSGITTRLKLNEVFVFGAGDLPDWVQRWEPTVEKADLLVLATHPDVLSAAGVQLFLGDGLHARVRGADAHFRNRPICEADEGNRSKADREAVIHRRTRN